MNMYAYFNYIHACTCDTFAMYTHICHKPLLIQFTCATLSIIYHDACSCLYDLFHACYLLFIFGKLRAHHTVHVTLFMLVSSIQLIS